MACAAASAAGTRAPACAAVAAASAGTNSPGRGPVAPSVSRTTCRVSVARETVTGASEPRTTNPASPSTLSQSPSLRSTWSPVYRNDAASCHVCPSSDVWTRYSWPAATSQPSWTWLTAVGAPRSTWTHESGRVRSATATAQRVVAEPSVTALAGLDPLALDAVAGLPAARSVPVGEKTRRW